jgi:MYXO-CTERM domain-containing protein
MFNRLSVVGVILAGFAAIPAVGNADTIAGWNFSDTASGGANNLAATVVATGITATVTRNGTVVNGSATATYTYDSKGWQSSDTPNNVQVGVTVTSGGPWDVTDLLFSAFRSGTGPNVVDVYYSADGGALTLVQKLTPITTSSGPSATNYDLALNVAISSSLYVYFVADASGLASGSSGTFRLNNVSDDDTSSATYFQLAGSQVVSVPSPAAIPGGIVGLVMVGAAAAIRRRRIAE